MRLFHIFYQFEIILEDAFISNNVGAITVALLREKASKSLVNRLNKVANKELDRSVFKSVTLLLRGIEDVCQSDEDCFNCLARQGLIYKINFLKMEEYKGVKDLLSLIEAFFDFFLRLPPSVEDRGQLTSVFLLHVGVVGTDPDVTFGLRLEAIRTINSILDNTTKEERRKLSLSKEHCLLLEQFAKVILNVGDYEMQVALSEALCRMTVKRSRKELANKWFANPAFAEGFNAINDREFEILFMPEDEKLEHFWVDFNLGTSCISLFVNDPEGSLWESIHLIRADVFRFSVCDCDDQTILTVHLSNPITHRMTKGKIVQIIFDSKHDILDAAQRVFESKRLLVTPNQSVPSADQPSIQHVMEPFHSDISRRASCNRGLITVPYSGNNRQHRDPCCKPDQSDNISDSVARAKTRLFSSQCLSSGGSSTHSTPTNKEKHKQKSKSKASPPPPPEAGSSVTLSQRAKHDYTRKKPKTKSKLKSEHATSRFPSHPLIVSECSELRWSSRHPAVASIPLTLSTVLPLSSPSSTEEASPVKHRTPSKSTAEQLFDQLKEKETLEFSPPVLNEEVESEMEMGSGVIAAFQTFKSQLRAHFSSRYKKIEARSLQSLTDCQKNVTSLLGAVHDNRLVHLERFQATVVQELGRLENDCISLKEIERETVNFWQSESQSVRSFCDRQQQRLESLGEPREGWRSSMSQREEAAAPPDELRTTLNQAELSQQQHFITHLTPRVSKTIFPA
ncbi:unnamed protein product [Coregonus sp. 'balchen']|nr:unnamed protein product [Coregonus sp. 'balchen']